MVQVLPPKFNVGTQIGQALGQGLQSGTQAGLSEFLQRARQDYQAQKLSETFKELQGMQDPVAVAQALGKASIYSPAADRTLASLGQYLIGKGRAEQLYGQEERGGTAPLAPAQAAQEASRFVEGQKPAGFLAPLLNPEQIQQYATRYAQITGDPNAFDRGLAQAQAINESRLQSRQSLEAAAQRRGITPEEMPRFLQNATEFQHLNDLPAIERAAIDKTLEIRNLKDSLKNATVPGEYAKAGGLKGLAIPGVGLLNALTGKGETRQKFLKKYDELVGKLVNEGEEAYVRKTLADVGLSPTEVEERIHPLTPKISSDIQKLPQGNKLNPKSRNDVLVKFFKNNVDNNTSLSVLRHYLTQDKNYDWQEVQSAVNDAFPNADNLTRYQAAELQTLANPPIQSLSQIFGPTPNLRGFFRGER